MKNNKLVRAAALFLFASSMSMSASAWPWLSPCDPDSGIWDMPFICPAP